MFAVRLGSLSWCDGSVTRLWEAFKVWAGDKANVSRIKLFSDVKLSATFYPPQQSFMQRYHMEFTSHHVL